MLIGRLGSKLAIRGASALRRAFAVLAPRAYTVIMFAALFCTVVVKFFQVYRMSLIYAARQIHHNNVFLEWLRCILVDVSLLLAVEAALALLCMRWPRKWAVRTTTVIAAVLCTWSVIYAGYLIRTGTEVLPRVLLPVVRDPANTLRLIGGNLVKMPVTAVVLLGPSAVALGFVIWVLAKPKRPAYNRRRFVVRVAACLIVALSALGGRFVVGHGGSGCAHSPHLRAVVSLFYGPLEESRRQLPRFDEIRVEPKGGPPNHNVVIVVLEGVQYAYTSLADGHGPDDPTPYLRRLAAAGVEFANARSTVTHTTKALFALLTGRFPSASEDLAEAIPVGRPYASLTSILREHGFRTAFFQSAKGDFEARPGLVHNLGFEKFWARDDLADPNHFIWYLASDEFAMLEPITKWIQQEDKPFVLTILCSVTHDPYDVPEWFGEREKEPAQRYRQTISYTDKFVEALDEELANLDVAGRTILCVVGDHGEAFGEHGHSGHDKIAFDEVLRVPFCVRAPGLVEASRKVRQPVSSIDLTPTLLELLGFGVEEAGFDGVDLLGPTVEGRRVYFSGWVREGPSGFVAGDRKFIYHPRDRSVCLYDLAADPDELVPIELPPKRAKGVGQSVLSWRRNSVFRLAGGQRGKQRLFDRWIVSWRSRLFVTAKYQPLEEN